MAHVELAASCGPGRAPRHVRSAAQVDGEHRTENRDREAFSFSPLLRCFHSSPRPARVRGLEWKFPPCDSATAAAAELATAHTAISTAGTRPRWGARPGEAVFDDTDGLAARVGASL